MHGALSAAAQSHPAMKEWNQRLESTAAKDREEEVLFDRELFYAMQSRDRLATMIQNMANLFV
jgi:hypothetical protein